MADDRKLGKAEAYAEIASRLPPAFVQGSTIEAEVRAALDRVGLELGADPMAKAVKAFAVLEAAKVGRVTGALRREATKLFFEATAPESPATAPDAPPEQPEHPDPEPAPEGRSRPGNGASEANP